MMANMAPELLAEIEAIDRRLLESRPGEEGPAADLLLRRGRAIEKLVRSAPSLEILNRLRENSERIEEKLLHWRRTTLADLSAVEQHLRFLSEAYGVGGVVSGGRIELTA